MYPACTFDFETETANTPDPLDYITQKTACACAPPGTPHPLWDAFLNRITSGNAELQRFLQRYIGYCCTGTTNEHVFVFAYGTGANGKGTFINTIVRIFGDYATVADMNTFLITKSERHPTDLAKLYGKRLVVAQEVEKGRRWDEAKIKTLTGGDKITARFMRQDFFDFVPTFKLFIIGNQKPSLNHVDEAIRRRLLLVPFTVKIPESERDAKLPEKLWDQERWAILRWCVEGGIEWKRNGLNPPAVVREATDSYFADQDILGQWIDECVERDPNVDTLTRDLFTAWKSWCEPRNLRYGTEKAFSESLTERGFRKTRNNAGRMVFAGIVLKAA
jgi:putative DNA primase/helicase